MSAKSRSNLYIGLIFVAFAVLLIWVWIPLDTKTGIVVKVRGRMNIGDALAPTVAASFLLAGGAMLALFERTVPNQPSIHKSQIWFIASLLGVLTLGFTIMRFAGPAAAELANLFRTDPIEYRLLRATPGWKHLGFSLGGFVIVTGIIAVLERGLSRRGVITGICAVLVLIAVFDLPFDDLMLPPNGDV